MRKRHVVGESANDSTSDAVEPSIRHQFPFLLIGFVMTLVAGAIYVYLALFFSQREFDHGETTIFEWAGLLCSVTGLCTGCFGLYRMSRAGRPLKGLLNERPYATLGLFLSLVLLVMYCLVLIPVMPRGSDGREECQRNLESLGNVLNAFASISNDGFYPLLSAEPGRLTFAVDGLYPEYLNNFYGMFCPNVWREAVRARIGEPDPDIVDDHSYFYLGYAVTNDDEVEAFAQEYRRRIAEGQGFLDDMVVAQGKGNLGTNTVFRLRDDIERAIHAAVPAKIQQAPAGSPPVGASVQTAEVPIMIERPENHTPPGGNVLYLDGHVDFIEFPGRWPMSEKTVGILNELDAMGSDANGKSRTNN